MFDTELRSLPVGVCAWAQDGLRQQNRDIAAETLTPLTPEVISRQATINIGTIGHVAHGKSTTVKAVSGVYVSRCAGCVAQCAVLLMTSLPLWRAPLQTIKYKAEKVRNITIKLGYANAKIFKSSAACVLDQWFARPAGESGARGCWEVMSVFFSCPSCPCLASLQPVDLHLTRQ